MSWPAAGLSSFIVYKLTGITYFQVVGTNSSSGNVGHSGPEGSRFEPGHVNSRFFKGRGRHLHFFLLLPNDTGAPCLGGIHIEPSFKLTKVQCTETWVSPRLRAVPAVTAHAGQRIVEA